MPRVQARRWNNNYAITPPRSPTTQIYPPPPLLTILVPNDPRMGRMRQKRFRRFCILPLSS